MKTPLRLGDMGATRRRIVALRVMTMVTRRGLDRSLLLAAASAPTAIGPVTGCPRRFAARSVATAWRWMAGTVRSS
jgi:hypothetical protein